jgi:hypothetical protein
MRRRPSPTRCCSRCCRRGYRPVEQTSVLYQDLSDAMPATEPAGRADAAAHGLRVRRIDRGEEALWSETSALGWNESPALAKSMRMFGPVCANSAGTHGFLVEEGRSTIAAAALAIHGGVGLLA